MTFQFNVTKVLAYSLWACLCASCGGGGYEAPEPPPPSPSPKPVPQSPHSGAQNTPPAPGLDLQNPVSTEARAVERPFWVASARQRFIVGYTPTGQVKSFIDLARVTGQSSGGVTALTFISPGQLAAFVDPSVTGDNEGQGGESLILVDTAEGQIKNAQWYRDPEHLSGVSVKSLQLLASGQLFVTFAKGVENVGFNASLAFRIPGLGGQSYVPAQVPGEGGTCDFQGITASQLLVPPVGGTDARTNRSLLLILARGGVHRLGLVSDLGQVPKCVGSLDDRTQGAGGISDDEVPVAAAQEKDSVYVLYQSITKPKIVRYQFDGRTLSDPALVFDDRAVLGPVPSTLRVWTPGTLLVANPHSGALAKVSTDGGFGGFIVRDSFTVGVSDVVLEAQ